MYAFYADNMSNERFEQLTVIFDLIVLVMIVAMVYFGVLIFLR